MKKVVVFLARGFEEIEALTVVDYLRRAAVDVTVCAVPEKGSMESTPIVTGSHGISVVTDMSIGAYLSHKAGEVPDAVYAPGGMPGAVNVAGCDAVIDLINECAAKGKIVAAICAAPVVVLAKTGLLAGRKYTCYPGMEDNLIEYCGSVQAFEQAMEGSALIKDVPFVFDNNVLTGRGPGTAEQFAMELVRLLCGEGVASKVKEGSCQR